VLDELLDLLEERCAGNPALLVLENLQWTDGSTLKVVHAATHRLRHAPFMLVGTCRPLPRSRDLEALLEQVELADGLVVRLNPLDLRHVEELVGAVFARAPGPRLMSEVERAGGNPFFILELCDAFRYEDVLVEGEDGIDLREQILPLPLRTTILRRLRFLSDDEAEALRVASVLGSTFSVSDLASVLHRRPPEISASLENSLRAGLIEGSGGMLSFRHDVVREALYEDMPEAVRSALHLEIGRTLAKIGAPADRVAIHFSLGATAGDAHASAWLRRAAHAAGRLPQEAADLLRRALHLAPCDAIERDALTAELIHALVWSGSPAEAERPAEELLDRPHDAAVEVDVVLALFRALFAQAKTERLLALIHDDVPRLGIEGVGRAKVLAEAAYALGTSWRDLDAASAIAGDALAIARNIRAPLAESLSYAALASAKHARGYVTVAVDLSRRAVTSAGDDPEAARRMPNLHLAYSLMYADQISEAEVALDQARRTAERFGNRHELSTYYYLLGRLQFEAGRWEDAVVAWDTALRTAEEFEYRLSVAWVHAYLCLHALHTDDLKGAQHHLLVAEKGSGHDDETCMYLRGLMLESRGELDAALPLVATIHDSVASSQQLSLYWLFGIELVRMAAKRDAGLARSIGEGIEMLAARAATLEYLARHAAALVNKDVGLMQAAVAGYEGVERPLALAAAREDAASLLAGAGRTDDARRYLEGALDAYESIGAVRDARRSEAALRGMGFRRGRRGPRTRASSGWGALTKTEEQVAAMVAEGFSNPEIAHRLFVSRRTIETHVSHIFVKLGLSSRAQLRDDWHRRQHVGA